MTMPFLHKVKALKVQAVDMSGGYLIFDIPVNNLRRIAPSQIMEYTVPLHYLT